MATSVLYVDINEDAAASLSSQVHEYEREISPTPEDQYRGRRRRQHKSSSVKLMRARTAPSPSSPRGASRTASGPGTSSLPLRRWKSDISTASSISSSSTSSSKSNWRKRDKKHRDSSGRSLLKRLRKGTGNGRNPLLKGLAKQRNDALLAHLETLDDEELRSLLKLQKKEEKKLWKKSSSSSSSVSSSESSGSTSSRSRKKRVKSLLRGDGWLIDDPLSRHGRRTDEKRVSMRGFTSEDGLLTREEARSFSEQLTSNDIDAPLESASISIRNLVLCARRGDTKRVLALVDTNLLDIDAPDDSPGKHQGETAIIAAASRGFAGTVIALFGRGAGVESKDAEGNTALSRAAANGHLEVTLTLLSAGADLNVRNQNDETVIMLCAKPLTKSKRSFDDRLAIIREIIERANIDSPRPTIFTKQDAHLIKDKRTRSLLEEWVQARAFAKDLHVPTRSEFLGEDLLNFFQSRHSEFNVVVWIKVFLLLIFVVYDVYLKHMGSSYATYVLYAILYFCAYSI